MCPQVASPTPRKQNNCPPKPTLPPPPEGFVINEFSFTNCTGVESQNCIFVELIGPPSTSVNGFVLVFFEESAKAVSVPLTGSTRENGLYLLENITSAGGCVWFGNVFFVRHSLKCMFWLKTSRLMCADKKPKIISTLVTEMHVSHSFSQLTFRRILH